MYIVLAYWNNNPRIDMYIVLAYWNNNPRIDMYIVLAYWNNNPRTNMFLHSDTLSWFRASQSLHSPEFSKYNCSCLWFDPTKGSNSKSTASDAIILTITLAIVSIFWQPEKDLILNDCWCFNATFNNISAISWENHRPWASNW